MIRSRFGKAGSARPGFSIVGGLLLSQLLTLYTIPVVYLYLDRLNAALGSLGRRRGTPKTPTLNSQDGLVG